MARALSVFAAAALVGGCGASNTNSSPAPPFSKPAASSGAPAATSASVQIKNFLFEPAVVTVRVGGTVKWTNQDSSEHTATPDSGSAFDTGTLTRNKNRTITFKAAGSFTYHCALHAFMHGDVLVKA